MKCEVAMGDLVHLAPAHLLLLPLNFCIVINVIINVISKVLTYIYFTYLPYLNKYMYWKYIRLSLREMVKKFLCAGGSLGVTSGGSLGGSEKLNIIDDNIP